MARKPRQLLFTHQKAQHTLSIFLVSFTSIYTCLQSHQVAHIKFLYSVYKSVLKKEKKRSSLVVQWIRSYLPIWGTWVPSLVWEDSTCHRVTKAYLPRACAPQQEMPSQ